MTACSPVARLPANWLLYCQSLLAVLGLGARRGSTLRLNADGPDADVALAALVTCVAGLLE